MMERKSIVTLDVMVHWGDMDALLHVNNIIYLKWVESTRLLLFEKLVQGSIGSAERRKILAWHDIKYIAPVVYPDTVTVHFDIIKIGSDRLHGQAKLYSKTQQGLVAISNNTMKAYNTRLLKKAELPSQWIEVLKGFYPELF